MKIISLKSTILLLVLPSLFIGCTTTYGPRNSMGGYEEKEVGKNMLRVSFYGNQHTTKEKVTQLLLYRCAEVTQESGFDTFVVLQDESYEDKNIFKPTGTNPVKTVVSESVGVRTVVVPDFNRTTETTNMTGVYIISMFNKGSSGYDIYEKSHIDAAQVLNDLKSSIK